MLIFVLFAPVQAAGRQNVELDWSNDAPLGGYQLADFDGDDKTDLFRVVGNEWQYASGGTGPWTTLVANDAALQSELRFGDFDGNGMTDIFHKTGNQWRYRPGGSGGWSNLWQDPDDTGLSNLRFADFNGDGRTDVFRRTNTGQWQYSASGLGAWQNLNSDPTPLDQLLFGYLDDNDVVDIFHRRDDGKWRFSSGGVAPWDEVTLAFSAEIQRNQMALGDFNGDGISDVFARLPDGQWIYSPSAKEAWQGLSNDPTLFSDLRFGDFDGDGTTDVFSLGPGNQPRYSSGGTNGWENLNPAEPPPPEPPPLPPGPAVTAIASLAFGDFNNDGTTDVFRRLDSGQWQYSPGGVGNWVDLNTDPLPLNQLRFGNFGGDGRTDVFSVDGSGQWRWSDGGAGNWQNFGCAMLPLDQLRFGDFDGNGTTDVFRTDAGQWQFCPAGSDTWENLAMDPLPLADLAFGDFDGNGITDVFSIDPVTNRGRYSRDARNAWENLDVQNIPLNLLRFADLDGNGRTDIFTRTDSGQWRILFNGMLPWVDAEMDPLSINDLRFGDFNDDGWDDVFSIGPDGRWRYSSGARSEWIPLGPPATPTPLPTSTPLPTGVVTPSPTPEGCTDILFNGDFEFDGGWIFGDSPVPGKYTGAFKQNGVRSMQLGIVPEVTMYESYSSVRQYVSISPNTSTVTLRWWQWGFSDEGASDNPGAHQDRFEIIALSPGGDTLRIIHRTRPNNNGWQQMMVDITEFAGKSFYLYFNLYNDGRGGRSWIFLDNMMLEVCPGSGPMHGGGMPGGGPQKGGHGQGPWQKPGGHNPWMPMTDTPTTTVPITSAVAPLVEPTATPSPMVTEEATDQASVSISSTEMADLSLSKSATPTNLLAGEEVVFTLVINNSGPMNATNVTVNDVLRPELNFVGSSGIYSPVSGVWTVGTLDAGMTATLHITATVQITASGAITNYAQVWTSDVEDPDSEPGDNLTTDDDFDMAIISVTGVAEAPLPDLAVAPQVAQAQPVGTPVPQDERLPECVELVENGGFESSTGWNMLQGPAAPTYSTAETFNNSSQAMMLGITDGNNLASISAIDQVVELPMDANSIILSFRYFPMYENEPGPGDLQYVDIYNVLTGQFAGRALGTQANNRTWLAADHDLTMQAGQTVRLVMAVNNDGVEGRSAMIVDNVSIRACNFGDLVNPGVVPTPDPALGVSSRTVADQPVLLAGREAESQSTWLARLSAMGVLASVAGVIAFAVMVVIGTLRQP